MVSVLLELVEALELLGMTLAHLDDAEVRAAVPLRMPMLMSIRDKLAFALREGSRATPQPMYPWPPRRWKSTEKAEPVRSVLLSWRWD